MTRLILLCLLFPAVARAEGIDDAVRVLSRYPAGMVPVEPEVMGAVDVLARTGGPEDLGVLRSLAGHERPEVRGAALRAIADIRDRDRTRERQDFADGLPDWPELDAAAAPWRTAGLGGEQAICAAYADTVLGHDDRYADVKPSKGDPQALLAEGKPRSALAAAIGLDGVDRLRWEAAAREDLGDTHGAVRRWAELAASGDADARDALDGFGIDSERLLLGMLATSTPQEAELLEVLVRHGRDLTVTVLSERTRSGATSERVTAADALTRMLDPQQRAEVLPAAGAHDARRALAHASNDQAVQAVAEAGLSR
jgi:hypothetical protein